MKKDIYLKLKYKNTYLTLDKEFTGWVYIKGIKKTFTIPKGLKTDFASIPTFLQFFLSPIDPKIAIPSVMHDFQYKYGKLTRVEADIMLYQKCRSFGLDIVRSLFVYFSVRVMGWLYYKKYGI
jgi:hypothetical protein